MNLDITFLGTGTSQGVPVIACPCNVCHSLNSHDKRLRTSIMIETQNETIVIDAGLDFRQQMLRENVLKLDAILITHGHKDHIGGLDDIRSFNKVQKKPMKVYADENGIKAIQHDFSYAFVNRTHSGLPNFDLEQIDEKPFLIGETLIKPITLMHSKLPVTAYRIADFTYITDANYISESSYELMKGTKTLVINALRKGKHESHFNLEEALKVIEKINPQKAYLTHVSHLMGLEEEVSKELPANVTFAYDGLKIKI